MNKYYLTRNYKGTKEAGNKAKIDVELALKTQGYRSIGGTRGESNSQIYSFLSNTFYSLKRRCDSNSIPIKEILYISLSVGSFKRC